jgi:prepilin-type processing-associated H-X9-DG protein
MRCGNNLKQFGIALHMYNDDYYRFPPGGYIRRVNINDPWSYDWNQDQGSWLLHTMPYMEQDALYKFYLPQINLSDGPGAWNIQWIAGWNRKGPKYIQCPSDDWDHETRSATNYAGSLGPQCQIGPCGYDPYQFQNCNEPGPAPNIPFIKGTPDNPSHGNSPHADQIRGCFNRLGAKIRLADLLDGSSNTILVGEVRPNEHDHMPWQGSWVHYNGGAAHAGTMPPINYITDSPNWCSPVDRSRTNWNISWGFKSRHPNGTQFLFGDGSVTYISQKIDYVVYQYLGCRNDTVPVSVPSGP